MVSLDKELRRYLVSSPQCVDDVNDGQWLTLSGVEMGN